METTDLPEEALLGPSEGGSVLYLFGWQDGKWRVQWYKVEVQRWRWEMDPF